MCLILAALCLLISGCQTSRRGGDVANDSNHLDTGLYDGTVRLTAIEKLNVGSIPLSATNLIEYLAWFNEKVKNAGLPQNCCLGINIEDIDRWCVNTMNGDMIIWAVKNDPGWFHELGISEPNVLTVKHELAKLNMREFLWLLRGVYSSEIEYGTASIKLGYGWGVGHIIMRSNRDTPSK